MPENLIFSHYQVSPLMAADAAEVMPLSPDLGLSTLEAHRSEIGWSLPGGQTLTHAHLDTILADQNSVYRLTEGGLEKIEAYSPRTNR
jgi:hypothetical protein